MKLDCPNDDCDAEIECEAWDSGPYVCPKCGTRCRQDSEYIDATEGTWTFWLVEEDTE